MSTANTDKQYTSQVIQVRLYPNKDQMNYLAQCFGCCRFLFNYFLHKTSEQYKVDGTFLWYNDFQNTIPKMKKQEETEWLKNVDSTCLQNAVRNLDNSQNNFVKSKQGKRRGPKVGFPTYKRKVNKQSAKFTSNSASCKVDYENRQIKIPKLKSWIKFANKISDDRIPDGKLQSITISKNPAGHYFASLLYKVEKKPINYVPNPKNCIGLDFGLKTFITTSNGDKIQSPKVFKKSQKRLARLSRSHSKKKVNSKNREKSRLRLAKQHEKVANQRKDFNHKTSRKLIDTYDFIFIEDLNIKGMNKLYGKQVNDLAWAQFVSFMNYKAINAGKIVFKIDRFYPSSKTCSHCGYVKDQLKLKERSWSCPHCNTYHDRDINAAINILLEGQRILFSDRLNTSTVGTTGIHACGDKSSDVVPDLGQALRLSLSKKQENTIMIGLEDTQSLVEC
jgi:putative transposase